MVSVTVGQRVIGLTNLDKALYPGTGTTKAEVLQYYAAALPALLGTAGNRPLTRIRWPEGTGLPSFYEKDLPSHAPSWIPRFRTVHSGQHSGKGEREAEYPLLVGDDAAATLTWLTQQGSLEYHVPQWQVGTDGSALPPDRLVVDLDPGPPAGLAECCEVAELVRVALEHSGLKPWAVTSGSKGIQVYAAVPGGEVAGMTTDEFARALAVTLEKAMPELIVSRMEKAARPGRVFIDWSQNNPSKTTVAPWSLRGKESPTVAMPVTWDEVNAGISRQFTMAEAMERLAEV